MPPDVTAVVSTVVPGGVVSSMRLSTPPASAEGNKICSGSTATAGDAQQPRSRDAASKSRPRRGDRTATGSIVGHGRTRDHRRFVQFLARQKPPKTVASRQTY